MKLSKKIIFSISATSVTVFSGFIRNKIFAIYLSIALFGILSLGQQLLSLIFTIFAFGLPLGISSFGAKVSTYPLEEQKKAISRIVFFVVELAIALFLILSIIISSFPALTGKIAATSGEYTFALSILLFAAPFMVIHNCLLSLMEGMGLVQEIVTFKIIPSFINLPLIYLLVHLRQFEGAAAAIVISEFVTTVIVLILLRKYIVLSAEVLFIGRLFTEIGKIAFLSVLVGAGSMLIDFLVKRYLLGEFGETNNGIVQSVAKVVDLYPTVVLSWLTMHLFPLMSASINDKKLIIAHLERTVNIAVALIIPIIVFIFVLRIPILQILYKHDFIVAEHYFAAMLLLGIPKVLTWVIGVPLLPLGMKKIWFWTSLLFSAVYGLIVFIFDPFGVGIFIIPIASFSAFIFQYGALLLMYRRNGFRFTREFGIQNALYGLMLLSLLLAVLKWEWCIAAVCIIYWYTLVKYKLWSDIKQRILSYAKKEP